MAGKPQREQAKQKIQAPVEEKACETLAALREADGSYRSTSQLVETLVLWERGVYMEAADERYLRRLQKIRAQRYLALESLSHPPARRRLHLTLDTRACEFIEFMLGKYPLLFRGRGEAVSLMVHYAGAFLRTGRGEHLRQRLAQVRENYPVFR